MTRLERILLFMFLAAILTAQVMILARREQTQISLEAILQPQEKVVTPWMEP